jgi:hypothetical protein
MAVLKHTYLEAHDNGANKHAYYLTLLIQEGAIYKALGYHGRIGANPAVASKYQGNNLGAAQAAFDKVVYEKGHKRPPEPSYLPATLPASFQAEINRLNAQAPVAPAASAPAAPAAPRTTQHPSTPLAPPTPAAPVAPFPLPEIVLPKAVDATTFNAAAASPAYAATISGGAKVFVVIPPDARRRAQIVDRARFPQSDSLNRFPALVKSLDPANPVLADSILAGEVFGNGVSLRIWDILAYRGNDVRGYSLSERLGLLYQAFNELAREGQLNPAWSLAEFATGAEKAALTTKGDVVLRGLAAPYDSADPTAAIRRA